LSKLTEFGLQSWKVSQVFWHFLITLFITYLNYNTWLRITEIQNKYKLITFSAIKSSEDESRLV
jgi:hypothetical protein